MPPNQSNPCSSVDKNALPCLRSQLINADDSCLQGAVSATLMPALFEDSTHQIWSIAYRDQNLKVLKLCQCDEVENAGFWNAMRALFDVSLIKDYSALAGAYHYFRHFSVFEVPALEAISASQENSVRWILTQTVHGKDLCTAAVTRDICCQLAAHLGSMHAETGEGVSFLAGRLYESELPTGRQLDVSQFRHKIDAFLNRHPRIQQLRECYSQDFQQIRQQLKCLEWHKIVPMLIDFRWDQLRIGEDGKLYLLDLDAALFAPIEMDWLMLELVLTPQQLEWVMDAYQGVIPQVSQCRELYRALFYAMELLGDQPWSWWKAQPILLP
ncbi:hypothetical protein [Thiomicrorhabdus xiamenensis]|uniref:Phosphotransferase enzyme family protein n=1 Tax=Thiomicrorhabdus xiamenensis TaxID=2739063 RepID=A0A7D4T0J5_9GAMM|nr:hypothetical protein [Thiomicrorhabdus xiamenensis]QKI88805.1 hypothetical protein HQN79_04100 [Thiomicrorhabdus xiamenensis]